MSHRSLKGKSRKHPFLNTTSGLVLNTFNNPSAKIGTDPVFSTFHHLYPQNRKDIPHSINKHSFVLDIWSHKHFLGWNKLFFIRICTNSKLKKFKTLELTIEEIICLMLLKHRSMREKVGTEPWLILFGKKNLSEAADLLLRLFYIKELKNNLSVTKEEILEKRKHVLKLVNTRRAA